MANAHSRHGAIRMFFVQPHTGLLNYFGPGSPETSVQRRIVFLYVRIQNLFMSILRRLFTSEARVRILNLLMTTTDSLHVREVARRTGLNLNSVPANSKTSRQPA